MSVIFFSERKASKYGVMRLKMASSFLWHTQEIDSVAHELKTDLEQGLSSKEASSRLPTYGFNELPEADHIPVLSILLRQQISLMIPVLVVVCVILILGDMWSSAFVVMGILGVNIIFSLCQIIMSQKFLKTIKKLASRSKYAGVLRSGHVRLVKTTELVPGDIICFEKGDLIVADGRLIEANDLTIDESLIMRTVQMSEKHVDALDEGVSVRDRPNMVFMGTIAIAGKGRAIVTSTGSQTQVAKMVKTQDAEATESWWSLLGTNLSRKGLWFAIICIICLAALWAILTISGTLSLAGVMIGLCLLVAIWPMGLSEAVSMTLAIGMKRLSENNIAIQSFPGAEALANATVICSDKEGILTQKEITVKRLFVDGRIMDIEGDGYDPESGGFPPDAEEENPDLPFLLTVAAMCTNTEIKNTPAGWSIIGDPAEGALLVAALKGGINKDELGLSLTKIGEFPFDYERKRMTTVYKSSKDEIFVFTKGFLETVLDVCSNIQLHGYVDLLDIGRHRAIWAVNHSFARDGMQNIAFAYCQLEEEPDEYTIQTIERNLVFIGIAGIIDPLRADAKSAIQKCLTGSIQPIILTDDYVDTTTAIANNLGIIKDGTEVLAGEELDILGEKEYANLAGRFSAYANISPDHRIRIVRTLKDQSEIIAIVSNHTSDSDIITEADIGIAAGQSGYSVATEAADIILMDNSFATAVKAIETMRAAYGNTRKLTRYLLSGSVATVGAILIALIINIFQKGFLPSSLSSLYMLFIYVLWINIVGGSIPAFAIIFNPVTDGSIKDGPYSRKKILDDGLIGKILIRGLLMAFLAMIAFAFSLGSRGDQSRAMTAALSMLVVSQIAFAFQCRYTPDEGFFRKYFTNKLLLIMAFLAVLIHASIIYIPTLSQIFGTTSLSLIDWAPIAAAFIICSLPLDELFSTRVEEDAEEAAEKDSSEKPMDRETETLESEGISESEI